VWVLDVTRFSRKVMEGERLVEAAQQGRRVWSQSGGYNLATADGRKAFRDAMVTAAAESDKISERTRRGRRRKARRGVRIAKNRGFGTPRWEPKPRPSPPGGRRATRAPPRTPVPDAVIRAEREIVRECYRRLLAGETNATALARELNGRGVRTVNGGEWTRTSLAEMLLRPALAGLIAVNGEIVAVERNADPVVGRAEWERLRSLLRARGAGRPPGRRHFLSGLMRCGTCRRRLAGSVVRIMRAYPDGSPRREYRCPRGPGRAGCGRNAVDARAAEKAVGEAVKTRLGDPRRAERIAARVSSATRRRTEITRELAHLDAEMDAFPEARGLTTTAHQVIYGSRPAAVSKRGKTGSGSRTSGPPSPHWWTILRAASGTKG
jgi:hypothetical protein